MSVFDMAKQYYPRLWDEQRIDALVAAGRLSQQERDQIVNNGEVKK